MQPCHKWTHVERKNVDRKFNILLSERQWKINCEWLLLNQLSASAQFYQRQKTGRILTKLINVWNDFTCKSPFNILPNSCHSLTKVWSFIINAFLHAVLIDCFVEEESVYTFFVVRSSLRKEDGSTQECCLATRPTPLLWGIRNGGQSKLYPRLVLLHWHNILLREVSTECINLVLWHVFDSRYY